MWLMVPSCDHVTRLVESVEYFERDAFKPWPGWHTCSSSSTTFLSMTARNNNVKCVAGDNLRISLEGINSQDATLVLKGFTENRTLVSFLNQCEEGQTAWRCLVIPLHVHEEKSGWVHWQATLVPHAGAQGSTAVPGLQQLGTSWDHLLKHRDQTCELHRWGTLRFERLL